MIRGTCPEFVEVDTYSGGIRLRIERVGSSGAATIVDLDREQAGKLLGEIHDKLQEVPTPAP